MSSVDEPSYALARTSVRAGRARWSDEAIEDLLDVVLGDRRLVQGLLIDPGNRANESLYQPIIRTTDERRVVA